MFFAIDLLIPQHGGKFSIAWIAATRGIKYVSKKDIQQCDIVKLWYSIYTNFVPTYGVEEYCQDNMSKLPFISEDIMAMVQRSSETRPRKRLSLSLSSRLINGLIKVHRCQVLLLMDDIMSFITKVSFPRVDRSITESEDGTPKRPTARVQRKRKAREIQLSDEVNDGESLLVIWKEPHIEITDEMRRQLVRPLPSPARVAAPAEPTIEETPIFGILDVDPPVLPEPRAPQPPVLGTPEKRKRADAQPETPSKRRAVLDAPGTLIRAMETEPVAASTQPAALPEEPEVLAQPIRPRQRANKANICEKRTRTVNINRCLINDLECFDIEDYNARKEIKLPQVQIDIKDMLGVFLPKDPANFIQEFRPSRRSTSLLQSTICESAEKRISSVVVPGVLPSKTLETIEEPQRGVESVVVEAEVHMPHKEAVEPPPPANIDSLPLREIQLSAIPPLQITAEEIIAPAAKTRATDKIVSPTAVLKKITRERQRNIRDTVKNWDFEKRPLAIEDVCPKPINRKNIAVTFNDLLSMSAMGYVNLQNKPDSLELDSIHKGRRLEKK